MKYLLLLVLFFAGCSNMTRTEVIAACKECTDAGMRPRIMIGGVDEGIRRVDCVPVDLSEAKAANKYVMSRGVVEQAIRVVMKGGNGAGQKGA